MAYLHNLTEALIGSGDLFALVYFLFAFTLGALAFAVLGYVWNRPPKGSGDERFSLLAQSPTPMYFHDITTNVVIANDAHLELFGIKNHRFTGDEWIQAVFPEDREGIINSYNEAVKNRQPISNELRILTADGSTKWLIAHAKPFVDINNTIIGYIGSTVDVSALKAASSSLQIETQRFYELLDLLPIGVCEISPEFEGRYVNRTLFTLLGQDQEDIHPERWMDGIHPDDKDVVGAQIYDAISNGKTLNQSYRMIRSDGSVIWIMGYMVPRKDANGQITNWICAIIDITERKLIEEQLQDSFRNLRAIASNLPGFIQRGRYTTTDYTTLYISEGCEKITGYTAEQYKGLTIEQLIAMINPDDHPSMARTFLTLSQQDQASVRARMIKADGTQFWGQIYITVVSRNADALVADYLVLDITDEMNAKADLERSEAERRQMEHLSREARRMEALGQLAGGIAHDFNNLLGAILGFSSFILEDTPVEDPRHLYAERIITAGNRGKKLVQQILTYARQKEIERHAFPIQSVIEEILALLKPSIPSSTSIVSPTDPGPIIVNADRDQLGQAIINLVVNAHDALHGVPGTITVSAEHTPLQPKNIDHLIERDVEGNSLSLESWTDENGYNWGLSGSYNVNQAYVSLIVEDTGSGIELADLGRIGTPFFTTKEPGKGTGLGLAMVYGIVLSHKGAMIIKTKPGIGTRIELLLPAG